MRTVFYAQNTDGAWQEASVRDADCVSETDNIYCQDE